MNSQSESLLHTLPLLQNMGIMKLLEILFDSSQTKSERINNLLMFTE